jgi:hypothetical protein
MSLQTAHPREQNGRIAMAKCTYQADAEEYRYPIDVKFDDIPPVRLKSIRPKRALTLIDRLVLATKPREFGLAEDWCIQLGRVSYDKRLNGSIVIPEKKDGQPIDFDGASIPLPWLVSLLTLGILRPLGVILSASIVHDYAYKFGHLRKDDGTEVPLERDVADRLFRDIIDTVNKLPLIGFIAWFAVRLGWPFVKYNGRTQGGKPPYAEYLLLLIVIALVTAVAADFSFSALVAGVATIYVVLYAVTVFFERKKLIADDGG